MLSAAIDTVCHIIKKILFLKIKIPFIQNLHTNIFSISQICRTNYTFPKRLKFSSYQEEASVLFQFQLWLFAEKCVSNLLYNGSSETKEIPVRYFPPFLTPKLTANKLLSSRLQRASQLEILISNYVLDLLSIYSIQCVHLSFPSEKGFACKMTACACLKWCLGSSQTELPPISPT